MRVLVSGLILSTLVVATGCDREPPREALREAELDRELAMALAAYPADNGRIQLGDAPDPEPEPEPAPVRQAAAAPRPQPVRRAQAAPQPVRQPQPRVVTETNVKRDAAIGAGVGAVAGAVVHRPNRWKGAVVGAAIGGAAGAVVGATIDRKTRVVYDYR